jgi:hypothetical protein
MLARLDSVAVSGAADELTRPCLLSEKPQASGVPSVRTRRTMKNMGNVLTAALQWLRDHAWRRSHPPEVGVREPRRPKPTLPAAAIALAEPRTEVRRLIRLRNLRDSDKA